MENELSRVRARRASDPDGSPAPGRFSWRVASDEISGSDEVYGIFELNRAVPLTWARLLTRVHPDDLPILQDMIARGRAGAHDFDLALRLQMPDRTIKDLHLVAHGTRDMDGRLEYVGHVRDVTERRGAEGTPGRFERDRRPT